jgi:hypothetical protein
MEAREHLINSVLAWENRISWGVVHFKLNSNYSRIYSYIQQCVVMDTRSVVVDAYARESGWVMK